MQDIPHTITIRSRCHEYKGTWTPERESLSKTLKEAGGVDPVFDFNTLDKNDYDAIKAPPMKVSASTTKRRIYEKNQVFVAPRTRTPDVPMVPFRIACDTVGILPSHLSKLVKSGNVNGCSKARMVSLSSVEAYMATR